MSIQLRIAIGLIVLVLMGVTLTSTPGSIFSRGVLLIDTELRSSSGNERFVKTNMDWSGAEQIESILLDETDWQGFPIDMSDSQDQLGAEVLLTWACRHTSSPKSVWFLVIQSSDVISFHPPTVCYSALGFDIVSEDTIDVLVSGEGWASAEWVEWMVDKDLYQGTISVKRLVITKENEGEITEKRVVLYYYLKDGPVNLPKEVTMIRVSAIVPTSGSYDDILALEKKIIADFFPLMFVPRADETSLGSQLLDEGVIGWLAILGMLGIPVGFMFYPVVSRKLKSKE